MSTSEVRWGSATGRWVIAATVGGSGLALLDSTAVNVALPAIGDDLGGGVAGLQWTVNAYTLTLAALILLSGSLADRFGRRRIFVGGVILFILASLVCALVPTLETLLAARAVQGIGAALLTPSSLAILESSFTPSDRARAIGAWSGLGAVAAAVGPLLGGWLVASVSWRAVFWINLPIGVAVIAIALRHVPESRAPSRARIDPWGAVLGALGLGAITWATIVGGDRGGGTAVIVVGVAGFLALLAFVVAERTVAAPMVPPSLFASRRFTGANLATFVVYGGMSGLFFLLAIYLQRVAGYTPLAAGSALLPVTLLMLLLSARAGALAERIGPRKPMTIGPLVMAGGMVLLARLDPDVRYLTDVLPGTVLFGLGLAATVAPLTATVLAAADDELAGIASGVNTAVARTASLLTVAVLPVAAGLTGAAFSDPARFTSGFARAILIGAALVASGGLLSWFTIDDTLRD